MALDMQKKLETVGLILTKRGIINVPVMKVAEAIDISGSMSGVLARGDVQQAHDQILAVGMRFDDNGELDVFRFDDVADYVGTATPDDAGDYLLTEGIDVRGGTAYSPIVRLMTESFFKRPASATGNRSKTAIKPGAVVQEAKKPSLLSRLFGAKAEPALAPTATPKMTEVGDMPVFAFIITDGQPQSEGTTTEQQYRSIRPALLEAQKYPIYLQFVGVNSGRETFEVLRRFEKEFPNVGFVQMTGFVRSDDEFYDDVITQKFADWVKATCSQAATA